MDPVFEKIEKLKELSKNGFNESSTEGRLFLSLLDVLDEICNRLKTLESSEVSGVLIETDKNQEEAKYEPDFSYTVVCPFCEEKIDITEDIVDNFEIICPNCGSSIPVFPDDLFFDF